MTMHLFLACPRDAGAGKIGSMAERTWQSAFRPGWAMATVLGVACVLGLTHIPGPSMPRILEVGGLDKLEHILAYGLITTLFLLSLRRPVRPRLLLTGLAALAVLAALDETTQPFVERTASLTDYASDLVGIAVPCIVWVTASRRRLRRAAEQPDGI
jgi:VanZ family protein